MTAAEQPPAIRIGILASGSFRPLTRAERRQARVCSFCGDVVLIDPMHHVHERHPYVRPGAAAADGPGDGKGPA